MKSNRPALSSPADKNDRDEAIHEARKSIKKVRALLRLVSAELGGTYPRENARLRDIARRLSEFRDAFAIIETFDDLKKKYKDETRNKLQSVRAGLIRKRKRRAGKRPSGSCSITRLQRSAKRRSV